jgi:hypothetical protein
MRRDSKLRDIVDATGPAGRLTGRLNGGKQQRDQNANDRDNDKQLNQRKTV